jgi:hypothetical protein
MYTLNIVENKMSTFTISLPEDLKKKIDARPEINWAEYLKQRFEKRINELSRFEELKAKGNL